MTGAEKIKSKILDDARAMAQDNIEKSRLEVTETMHQADSDIEDKQKKIMHNADVESAEVIKRMIAVAQLEGRKEQLKTKQELIGMAFEKAMEKLVNMPDTKYQKLIEDMVVSTAYDGNGEIVLSQRDKTRMDKNFTKNITDRLKKKGVKAQLKLSDKTADIKGGFILKKGSIEINQAFETIFTMKKDKLEQDVVEILFA